jgi:hypothetical protein
MLFGRAVIIRKSHLVIGLVDMPVAVLADMDSLVERRAIIAARKALAAVNLFRNQVMKCQGQHSSAERTAVYPQTPTAAINYELYWLHFQQPLQNMA